MITDLIIGIILIIIFFLTLPLLFAALFWIIENIFSPIWEWYGNILEGWYDNLKEGDDE